MYVSFPVYVSPVGGRIHQLHLCREVRPPHSECPIYDIKQSDGKALVLELWGMQSVVF